MKPLSPEQQQAARERLCSVIAQFWGAFEHRVNKRAEISSLTKPIAPNEVRDALRQRLVDAPDFGPAHAFFVDQKPDANWAHECAYAFIASDGRSAWCEASWPPDESFDFEPVAHLKVGGQRRALLVKRVIRPTMPCGTAAAGFLKA